MDSQLSLEELALQMGKAGPGSLEHNMAIAELTFRQTTAQLEVVAAQIQAAQVEEKAARVAVEISQQMRKSMKYMLWAAIAAVVSAVLSLASVVVSILNAWPSAHLQ